jgi:hypothetical protein
MEYNLTTSWNLGIQSLSTSSPDIFSQASNPRKITQLQDADYAGVFGPMSINAIFYTKDGTLVAAGNNDRLTESASRELGIGTYKNGVKRNFSNAEMRNYEFVSMCLSQDASEVYISAMSKFTGVGKIFRYNPTTNTIVSAIDFPLSKNPGSIKLFKDNLVAGISDDVLYLVDVNTKAIVWKTVLGSGQRINAFAVAPDGNIWINYNYLSALTTKLVKFEINAANTSNITSVTTDVTIIKTPDNDESTKPNGFVFMKSEQGNTYDLYISGFRSLYRMRNAVTSK